jgi:uncharacterized membrane protein YfcA
LAGAASRQDGFLSSLGPLCGWPGQPRDDVAGDSADLIPAPAAPLDNAAAKGAKSRCPFGRSFTRHDVSATEIALLALAGFAGGIANAVAGGGSFFTFSALVAFGMATLDANATSAVALVPGSLAIGAAYRKETLARWREVVPFAAIGIAGGIAGAWLLIAMGDARFRPLVPWLLGGATLVFALSGTIRAAVARSAGEGGIGPVGGYALIAVVAVYGGFFGAGMGIMLLAALALIEHGDFHKANATKNVVATLAQGVAVVLFIVGGLVHWPEAIVTTLAAILGGYLGVIVARRVPETIVRWTVVAVGAALTLIFALR